MILASLARARRLSLVIAALISGRSFAAEISRPLPRVEEVSARPRHIAAAYAWTGVPDRFRNYSPDQEHCYDAEIQAEALAWFDRHLKGTTKSK
jgi:hypothetical protein